MLEDLNIESEDNSIASTLDIAAALLKQYLNKFFPAKDDIFEVTYEKEKRERVNTNRKSKKVRRPKLKRRR